MAGINQNLSASSRADNAKVSVLLKFAEFTRAASVPVGAATPPPSRAKVWLMLGYKF